MTEEITEDPTVETMLGAAVAVLLLRSQDPSVEMRARVEAATHVLENSYEEEDIECAVQVLWEIMDPTCTQHRAYAVQAAFALVEHHGRDV